MILIRRILSLLALTLLGACSKGVQYHGYNLDQTTITRLSLGKIDVHGVIELLGTPTSAALYGEPRFFYISHKYKTRMFLNPILIDQDILQISFTNDGILKSVSRYGFSQYRKNYVYDHDNTYLPGNKISVLKQAIGNIGKFSDGADGRPY